MLKPEQQLIGKISLPSELKSDDVQITTGSRTEPGARGGLHSIRQRGEYHGIPIFMKTSNDIIQGGKPDQKELDAYTFLRDHGFGQYLSPYGIFTDKDGVQWLTLLDFERLGFKEYGIPQLIEQKPYQGFSLLWEFLRMYSALSDDMLVRLWCMSDCVVSARKDPKAIKGMWYRTSSFGSPDILLQDPSIKLDTTSPTYNNPRGVLLWGQDSNFMESDPRDKNKVPLYGAILTHVFKPLFSRDEAGNLNVDERFGQVTFNTKHFSSVLPAEIGETFSIASLLGKMDESSTNRDTYQLLNECLSGVFTYDIERGGIVKRKSIANQSYFIADIAS